MSSPRPSALIVGAGIIGLTTAFVLARAGVNVTIFDPEPARGATWAAAGMVAPAGEISPGERANFELQGRALAAWRELGAALQRCTGDALGIHQAGTLLVGWDAGDRRHVDQFVRTASEFGAVFERVARSENPERFGGLASQIVEGVWMPEDAWLDPDQAVSLLQRALAALGVTVVEQRVERVEGGRAGVIARTADETFEAPCGIFATGAAPLPPGAVGADPGAVRPVRGVTVRIHGVDRGPGPMIRSYVRGRPFYLLSRPGGYGILGATTDEHGSTRVELGELQRLLRDGRDLVPELEAATFVEVRSGLRPASANLRPFFTPLASSSWAWSSGHYRHGVTLAALAARDALAYVEDAQ